MVGSEPETPPATSSFLLVGIVPKLSNRNLPAESRVTVICPDTAAYRLEPVVTAVPTLTSTEIGLIVAVPLIKAERLGTMLYVLVPPSTNVKDKVLPENAPLF